MNARNVEKLFDKAQPSHNTRKPTLGRDLMSAGNVGKISVGVQVFESTNEFIRERNLTSVKNVGNPLIIVPA